MTADHGVGVDIGGTKIAAGLVSETGRIIHAVQECTPDDAGLIAPAVAELVNRLLASDATGPVGAERVGGLQLLDRVDAVHGLLDLEAGELEVRPDEQADGRRVVDHQDTGRGAGLWAAG
jgi:hypothetical protein